MSSIKETRAAIRAIPNMTASCVDGEWRVTINIYRLSERHPGKPHAWCEEKQEAIAYYTDDAEDALGTARQMSEQWAKQELKWPKDAALTEGQESFVGVLRSKVGLPRQEALWLQGRLHELSAQHAVLVNMGAAYHEALSSQQDHAFGEIETRIRDLLSDVPGVKSVTLTKDPLASRALASTPIRDHRGKVMVKEGRHRVAQHVRFLRRNRHGNAAARLAIKNAATAYAREAARTRGVFGTVEVRFHDESHVVPLNPQRVDELFNEPFWNNYPMNTLYVNLSIEDTGNAAFVDLGRAQEVARIVEKAADDLQNRLTLLGTAFRLHDINGNGVGELTVVQEKPAAALAPGAVRLVIETGNAAFEADAAGEAARILRDAAATIRVIRADKEAFRLLDSNGNVVGDYAYCALPSLERDGVIDMKKALAAGRVYLAESGFTGLAEDDYRFIVTAPDFEPGYGQGEGEVWLVNAKGEIASGYEHQETVRENLFDKMPKDMAQKLDEVVAGRLSFEDFEREFGDGDAPEPD